MDDAEWLSRTDLRELTAYLRFRGSPRKRRLFAVACARTIWDRVPPGDMRRIVAVAERAADGAAPLGELYDLVRVLHAYRDAAVATVEQLSWAFGTPERQSVYCHCLMTGYEHRDTSKLTEYPWQHTRLLTEALQPHLFRDIFGNPFRPVAFDPGWRTSTAVALARGVYESRDFAALPILADALQDVGCESGEVLDHCRNPELPHARGCWVVDLVLGKE